MSVGGEAFKVSFSSSGSRGFAPTPPLGGDPQTPFAAHSTTSERVGLLAPKPLDQRSVKKVRCSLRSQRPSGGVCYQYIFFFHFFGGKGTDFFRYCQTFDRKSFDGGRMLSILFILHFFGGKADREKSVSTENLRDIIIIVVRNYLTK